MELFRILGPEELVKRGDIAITDEGLRIEVVGLGGIWTVAEFRSERRNHDYRTHRIISVERARELDLNYILAGLEKIRKELWSEY